MKTNTITRHVETSGVGSQTSFSIKANGKAFRSLIDNVYTDKVTTPVRELMTNAFDSHIAAGKQDEPFTVIVPTNQDPRFGVRDFGTGMDHDTVTTLYTTLFDSSKDETNDQVGQLGLGSKSPFAYTDTFTVTCFDGVAKRVYTAFMSDDLPQLALLHSGTSSEPQGVLVEFPVALGHVGSFATAIGKVSMGFELRPTFVGSTISVPSPISSGDGWAIYEAGYSQAFRSSDTIYVRQGCVIYPTPENSRSVFPTSYDKAVVIDVPIGTAQVTLSREALSWDEVTREGVLGAAKLAWANATASLQAQYDAQTSTVAKMKFRNVNIPQNWWSKMTGIATGDEISLRGELDPGDYATKVEAKTPGFVLYASNPAKSYGVTIRTYSSAMVNQLDRLRIVLMDDVTPRRKGRVLAWGREHDTNHGNRSRIAERLYLPLEGQAAAVKRIKKLWDLDDSQFIPVAALDDVERKSNGISSTPMAKPVLQELQDKLDTGALWVTTHMRSHKYAVEGAANLLHSGDRWTSSCTTLADALPHLVSAVVGDDEIVFLNRKQTEELAPSQYCELSVAVERHASKYYDILRHNMTVGEIQTRIRQAVGYEAAPLICKAMGVAPRPASADLISNVRRWANATGVDISENEQVVSDTMKTAKATFPQLFPLTSTELAEYITTQSANLNKENTPS